MTTPKRILVAKPGLDGHDRGAKVVARALRDAGFEVIYTGLRQTPAQIAQAAVQEDVDAVGLSSLSGAHRELFPAVVRALREAGAGDVVVFGGGVIPQEDVAVLVQAGIERLFPPGTDTREIVRFLRKRLGERDAPDVRALAAGERHGEIVAGAAGDGEETAGPPADGHDERPRGLRGHGAE